MSKKGLLDVITQDWFIEAVGDDRDDGYKRAIENGTTQRDILCLLFKREISKIDANLGLTKLRDVPDRDSYALMLIAQREAYQNMLEILINTGVNNG